MVTTEGLAGVIAGALAKGTVSAGGVEGKESFSGQTFMGQVGGLGWSGLVWFVGYDGAGDYYLEGDYV